MRSKLICQTVILLFTLLMPIQAKASPSPAALVLEIKDQTFVYDKPGLGQKVIRVLSPGTRVLWDGVMQRIPRTLLSTGSENPAQVFSDTISFVSYQISVDGVDGWTDNISPQFVNMYHRTEGIGKGAVIRPNAGIVLYERPTLQSTALAAVAANVRLSIVGGPTVADLYTWWQVKAGDKLQGWVFDTLSGLEVLTPVPSSIGKYAICDGMGADFISELILGRIIASFPAEATVRCVATIDLKGEGTPSHILVLSQARYPSVLQDSLTIFERDGDNLRQVYRGASGIYSGIGLFGIYDLTGDGTPTLLWTGYATGSGALMGAYVVKYMPALGVQEIFKEEGVYRGVVQPGLGSFVLIGREGRGASSNCCLDGLTRRAYVWQNDRFVRVIHDGIVSPDALLRPKDISIHSYK